MPHGGAIIKHVEQHPEHSRVQSECNRYLLPAEEQSITIKYSLDDTTLLAESEEELKSLLMRVKEESTEVGLKLNIKKTKIMASGSITSWQIDGEEVEVVTDFIFLGSKIRQGLQPRN
ncbi:putative uncharacterized transposon-derived protein F52C9.6 [Varanus komodoensis]|nr:putative uncharacterized transposon-derived protein F52C9.6 [Varanus komodoensis]